MAYSPVKAETFGGLSLNDPGEVGWNGAIDLYNVEVEPGRIRTRAGYDAYANTASANVDSLQYIPSTATAYFIGGTTTPTLQVYSAASLAAQTVTRIGGGTGTTQSASASPHNFVSFGDATHEYVYIANGTDQVRRLEPSTLTFTAPAGLSTYKGPCLAVTPWDNRLVINGDTNLSRVWFSDAGTPETIGANNYVDLEPGDGERIVAIKAWRDLLFVFKPSKFYVFRGTDTDGNGNPIFRYHSVKAGIGLDGTSSTYAQRAVAAGPDGLYFLSGRGIFRTTGGPAEEVSTAIRPLFYDSANLATFFTGSGFAGTIGSDVAAKVFLKWADGRLYVKTAGDTMLVFDPAQDAWMYWSLPASVVDATTFDSGGVTLLLFAPGTSFYFYYRRQPTTDDHGTAITSYYRSGFSDLGSPDLKTIREWKLQGFGSPTFKFSYDFGSLDAGAAVTLGTKPAVAESRRRVAVRGRQFSWQVGKTSGQWQLNSIVANVREKRAPGVHASA